MILTQWSSRENSLELIELSSINIVRSGYSTAQSAQVEAIPVPAT